jgi:tetratricopeptide (TPR) repeat protein
LDRLALVSSEVLLDDQMLYLPKAQLYAQTHGLMGNRQLEQAYYDSTRSNVETRIREHPDDSRYRSALGIAYAGLGRKEEAIREGELAVELLPMSKEAWRGAHRLEDLARIYTMVGEYDAAIDQLNAQDRPHLESAAQPSTVSSDAGGRELAGCGIEGTEQRHIPLASVSAIELKESDAALAIPDGLVASSFPAAAPPGRTPTHP